MNSKKEWAPCSEMTVDHVGRTVSAGGSCRARWPPKASVRIALYDVSEEIPMHIRATQNTGGKPQDVLQAFMHVAVYAGVPKANHWYGCVRWNSSTSNGG